MTAAYEFHPEAEIDLEEIWENIAVENVTVRRDTRADCGSP